MPGDVMDNTIGVTATDPGMIAHPDEKHQGPSSSHATTVPPVMGGQAMGTVALTEEELHDDSNLIDPTEEEFHTLRRVPNKIPWLVYTIAFVELCERFSYYGTTIVCKLSSLLFPQIFLTIRSYQFHSTASSTWFQDWCWWRCPRSTFRCSW